MSERINESWREQRKAVVAHSGLHDYHFISVWQAANYISTRKGCTHETAKKEIKKAIETGSMRYGYRWRWRDE